MRKNLQTDKFIIIKCSNNDTWLKTRGIGGSDAAVIVGLNKYKTKRDLYYELVNKKNYNVVSKNTDNKATLYGKHAEPHIRALFALLFTEYEVIDPPEEIEILQSTEYPFMTATLDGILVEKNTGRVGILEIKTCRINNSIQEDDWKNQIPQNYYCQILHYLKVTGYDFVVVCYQLIYERDGKVWTKISTQTFERKDCEEDINYLVREELSFYNEYVVKKIVPPLTIHIDL